MNYLNNLRNKKKEEENEKKTLKESRLPEETRSQQSEASFGSSLPC